MMTAEWSEPNSERWKPFRRLVDSKQSGQLEVGDQFGLVRPQLARH